MPKTLAQLRADKPTSRPERSLTVCLAPHLVAEVLALTGELDNLPSPKASPRIGVGEHPRAAEIRERLAALVDEMAEHEGELRVRAADDGVWRRWTNDHPARQAPAAETETSAEVEGEPGWARDQQVASGYCNADDLIDNLGTYAHSWNGEELVEGDWDILRANIGNPDLKQIATAVVAMHESRLDFRQWRTSLSAALTRSDDSEPPETSGLAPAASTAGSPRRPSAGTTKTAARSRSPKPGK